MASLFFVCGQPDGPTAGTPIFNAKFLSTCIVDSMVVNNVSVNCVYPSPDFNHYPNQRLIVRNTGTWVLNDKIQINFTPLYTTLEKVFVTTPTR